MKVLNLSDYFVELTEEICKDKFENDIMLVFNNFTDTATVTITYNIMEDVKKLSRAGIVFDNSLIKVICTMYLGLAWSMYRKGKAIEKEKLLVKKVTNDDLENEAYMEALIDRIRINKSYLSLIKEIAIRYYTLYFSKYTKDIFIRMDIVNHPDIDSTVDLKNYVINNLIEFGINTLALGVNDEYMSL
ncbi:MAG: hypothetical protein FH751_16105 [Firmicutes bacterium]|nr:hypothetical protein [Bacillota bacterium]